MPNLWIKICGLRDAEAANAAIDAGASALGMVFVPGTPRHIHDIDRAHAIVEAARQRDDVETVGLFVDRDIDEVRNLARLLELDAVQLHGHETTHYASELKPLRVYRSLPFNEDLATKAMQWRDACANLAGLIIDAPPPFDAGAQTGGHGRTFDWRLLAELKDEGAFEGIDRLILAGGLTPDNVAEAISVVQPHGVDVSSGVENAPGVKNAAKIKAFCEAARHAAQTV